MKERETFRPTVQLHQSEESKGSPAPLYVRPKITTYTSQQILSQIGPAQACASYVPGGGAI